MNPQVITVVALICLFCSMQTTCKFTRTFLMFLGVCFAIKNVKTLAGGFTKSYYAYSPDVPLAINVHDAGRPWSEPGTEYSHHKNPTIQYRKSCDYATSPPAMDYATSYHA